MSLITEAIHNLRPNTEWVIQDNDLSTLQFIKPKDVIPPTKIEIEQESAAIELAKQNAKAAKAEQRAALLQRLGITEEEAKLLLS